MLSRLGPALALALAACVGDSDDGREAEAEAEAEPDAGEGEAEAESEKPPPLGECSKKQGQRDCGCFCDALVGRCDGADLKACAAVCEQGIDAFLSCGAACQGMGTANLCGCMERDCY